MANPYGLPQRDIQGFSPLHEGDTSVAQDSGDVAHAVRECFSPLHEGDTSVASAMDSTGNNRSRFSPLHEGDTSVAHALQRVASHGKLVSVPFTRGTPPWLV